MLQNVIIPLTINTPGIIEDNGGIFLDLDIACSTEFFGFDLEVYVCPVCGKHLLTMKYIRENNLWFSKKSLRCACGFNTTVFLYSHE